MTHIILDSAALVSTFWEIPALASTALLSPALLSPALLSPALLSPALVIAVLVSGYQVQVTMGAILVNLLELFS